jgi:hypothetical protein
MDKPELENITKLYENLTYFDQYGGSVILFIIITIIVLLFVSYCYIMINSQAIINDWPNQRCKPSVIPFAGLITHPDDVTASEYTQQNFTYCIQNTVSTTTGFALEPLTYIVNMFQNMANNIKNDLQNVRGMFNKIRNMFQEVSQEIMGRIMNFTVSLQQIILSFKDLVGKIQGVMTSALFTLLGSYYTLKSLMGVIAQFIVSILITLSIMVAGFWAVPITWGAAAANTTIFVAIAIPMIIILSFMKDILKVNTGLKVPKIKCFDKNTIIKMNDGTERKIIDIKVGDILTENNEVTACFKLITRGSIMHKLGNVIVSDSHIVNYNNKWIHVSEHPEAIKYKYDEPFLYCLNTTNKTIVIDNFVFTDWDEIYDSDFDEIKMNASKKTEPIHITNNEDIHKYLETGLNGSTAIKLENGKCKEIKEIEVDDILEHGEKVYGIVKINGSNIDKQIKICLGKNTIDEQIIEAASNLTICDKNITYSSTLDLKTNENNILNKKHKILYHLLTDSKTFYVDKIRLYDYNAGIDLLLEKNREKLLSIKYV